MLCALGSGFAGGGAGAQLIETEKPREIRGMELQNNLGKKLPLSIGLEDSNGKKVKLADKFGRGARWSSR